MPLDQLAQGGQRQAGGIDRQIGDFPQGIGLGDFSGNAVRHPALRRHRMTPAGFGVAAQQRGLVGGQIHQLRPALGVGPQACQHRQHGHDVEAAGADIDADRQVALGTLDHRLDHRQRHVIHSLVAEVFKDV